MKICFICGEYPPGSHGGIGTMTQVLGRALVTQGHDVRVIGIYPPNCRAPEFEVDLGVRVWRLRDSLFPGGWIASRYQLHRKVSEWVRRGVVDIVEVPDYQGCAAGWKNMAAPVIARLHGSLTYFAAELQRPGKKINYWLERASLRRADFVCSVCNYTAQMTQHVFSLPLGSSAVLYNPVELVHDDHEMPRVQDHVVFSGTMTGKKGIVALIKAWSIVIKSRPDSELHIYGKDARADNGQSMQVFLTSLLNGGRSSVHFHGHVSRQELLDVYKTSGVAVFPSLAEAFAIAPLEAMASGCPTVYSQRGSGSELMEHGIQGLLVDPEKPEQIAEAILNLQTDPIFARRLGEAGREKVRECFSIDKLTAQNVAFYESCIEQFHSSEPRAHS